MAVVPDKDFRFRKAEDRSIHFRYRPKWAVDVRFGETEERSMGQETEGLRFVPACCSRWFPLSSRPPQLPFDNGRLRVVR